MRRLGVLLLTVGSLSAQTAPAEKQHLFIHVALAANLPGPYSGRLLVFIAPGKGAKEVEANPFKATPTFIAAKEVENWKPGAVVDVDADDTVYPEPLSRAKPGDYQVQAVLDVGHTYNYFDRAPGDLLSDVEPLGQGITLSRAIPNQSTPHSVTTEKSVHPFTFVSKALTEFWGRETTMRGYVVTPPSYDSNPKVKFPTVYWTHGFGGSYERIEPLAGRFYQSMEEKKMPEMIWVVLDESCPTGTHEFADSVNNGPWGKALTSELIPHLEATYRMDAKPTGRFLQGHSSGGWATLWLQISYPKIFGGTWSTSPDPSDFHDFTSPDLYAPHANVYGKPDGTPYPLVRDNGNVVATFEQVARQEEVTGTYGGQIASFEWVFSPRGQDGKPMQMFNRATGNVDPFVVAYGHDHYDIAHLVAANWKTIGPDLKGKIHLFVGTADTFYLDGPAHKLKAVLDSLNADAHCTFIPDRTHFDLYKVGEDREGLFSQIAGEMYAVARPSKKK
jgi:S-formylglutathione hydrolase FrmB